MVLRNNVAATVPVPLFMPFLLTPKRGQAPSPQPLFAGPTIHEATEPVPFSSAYSKTKYPNPSGTISGEAGVFHD